MHITVTKGITMMSNLTSKYIFSGHIWDHADTAAVQARAWIMVQFTLPGYSSQGLAVNEWAGT